MSLMNIPSPKILNRAKAIEIAMIEISKLYSRRQFSDALKSLNGPRTDAVHALSIRSDFLVWKIHEKKWNSPC